MIDVLIRCRINKEEHYKTYEEALQDFINTMQIINAECIDVVEDEVKDE